jgi:hypothetical protein
LTTRLKMSGQAHAWVKSTSRFLLKVRVFWNSAQNTYSLFKTRIGSNQKTEVFRALRTRLNVTNRINSSREVALSNAVVTRARRWRPQVNGRKNNNKSKLLGRAEFTRRPGA